MKLRDYQLAAVEAVIDCWRRDIRRCLVVLPTGCGKTVVFGELTRRVLHGEITTNQQPSTNNHQPPPRAMILAHRGELIQQAADKVGRMAGVEAQIEMGELRVLPMFGQMPSVVVSTVQTQNTGRMHLFPPEQFGLLVIDEAHHATAASYLKCVEHYLANPACRLVGVTATPDRADEQALGRVFDAVAYEYPVTRAIADGWLVPVKQRLVKVESLDFSGISTTAGDLNQGELAEVLEDERNLHAVATPMLDICGERRAIVFATSVKQAERLAEIVNRFPGRSARMVSGKTEPEERKAILADFREGRVQYVVNVGVLTEGFDDAGVEVVVMARPTKSRALYAQMAGRATRPAADIAAKLGECADAAARRALIAGSSKPSCLILDFVGNSGRHKLVTTADILGGRDDDPDAREAREIVRRRCEESGEPIDMAEEVGRTLAEIKAAKLADAKRRAFIQATARYTAWNVDAFNTYDLPPVEGRAADPRIRLSYKQQAILRERVKVDPADISAPRGRQLLDEYFRRIGKKLATIPQTRFLRRNGIPVPMTFAEASRTITRLINGGAR